jgi:hypothetical protein
MALLLAGVRGIASIQKAQRSPDALEVIVTGTSIGGNTGIPA